tara:strand:+ start:817 stop:984 length:168 start_codon:yes stop_codon:yes gene_type:complete
MSKNSSYKKINDKKNAFTRKTYKQKTEDELKKDVFDVVNKIIEEKKKNKLKEESK